MTFGLFYVPGAVNLLDEHTDIVTEVSPSTNYETAKTRTVTPAAGKAVEITRVEGDVAGDSLAPLDPTIAHLGYTVQIGAGGESSAVDIGENPSQISSAECTSQAYDAVSKNVSHRGGVDESITIRFKVRYSFQNAATLCTRNNRIRGRALMRESGIFAGHAMPWHS